MFHVISIITFFHEKLLITLFKSTILQVGTSLYIYIYIVYPLICSCKGVRWTGIRQADMMGSSHNEPSFNAYLF